MHSQRIARIFGILFLITFITSIPALILFQPVLDDPTGYVANGGSDNRIFFGALLELLLIIANIGTAVVIYPIVKRQNHILALGYVTARIVECTFILVGILAVLSIVTLSQQDAGGDEGAIAYTLAALKDWTFILGPGFIVGWGNGLILGYLMYASGLVPRKMTWLGLVGGPLIIISGIAVMFGGGHPHEWYQGIATIPEALWELALGIYATVWGFRRCPILDTYDREFPVKGTTAVAPAY
jgi:peptidoglycan/LPS O-acetylase OafA/YrhL